jgi:tRNA pseudouridine55 synthase
MATGLLVLFVGPATKLVSKLPGEKTYVAALCFGEETDTYDTEGTVVKTYGHIPTAADLAAVLPHFTGDLMQVPPMVSAVKVGGKKLYELARKGIEIERKPRPVTIHELTLQPGGGDEHTLLVRCSAGTYVRALIHDIGHALGSGAVMTGIRRTASGPFSVTDAVPVDGVSPERLLAPQDGWFS